MYKDSLISLGFTGFAIFLPIVGIQNAFWLHQISGIPTILVRLIVILLPIILWFEIVVKILFLQTLNAVNFTSIEIDPETDIASADLVQLHYYDSELARLGFEKITDFTAPTLIGVARLFAHPEHHCFAEVGFIKNTSPYCSIIAVYSDDWSMSISNQQVSLGIQSIMYAFLRLSKDLVKYFPEEPSFLLHTFKVWNQEITDVLKVDIIKENTADYYFAINNQRRIKQKKGLMSKSIILGLLDMWSFRRNPKSEWMDEYLKINK